LKFISDTKWLPLITETYLEGLDAHNLPLLVIDDNTTKCKE
jgi:hypothetical protein